MSNISARAKAGVACFTFGAVSFLLGAYLVHRAGDTVSGSPFGWALIGVGIVGLLSVLAVMGGAYSE